MPDDPTTKLRSLNPLKEKTVDEERLSERRDERVRELMASEPGAEFEPEPRTRPGSRFSRLRIGMSVGVIGVIAAILLLTGTGGGSGDQTAYAYSARAMSFARSTPLVLLESPGWRVRYVESSRNGQGTMVFRPQDVTGPRFDAELSWQGGPLKKRRYIQAYRRSMISREAPVLGTTALVYEIGYSKSMNLWSINSRWRYDGWIMQMRAMVPTKRTFLKMLASLRGVDAETWLDAMPLSVIKAVDTPAAVDRMLEGVPLPPGFDTSKIRITGLAQDRYQLSATVTGTVVCSWFNHWARARKDGDTEAEKEAVEAMATAREWPILVRMSKTGGYPEVIWSYAEHMRSGKYFGRPLHKEVVLALGCTALLRD